MYASGPSHSYPPVFVDELHDAVGWWTQADDVRWAEGGPVDLVLAATELAAWINDPRPFETRHRGPWKSAISDFRAAEDSCGPEVKQVLGGDLVDVLHETQAQPEVIAAARQPAQAAMATLTSRLNDPAVIAAAWRDLREACQDVQAGADVVAYRRDLFLAVLRRTHGKARGVRKLLCGVLHDNAAAVAEARHLLGDATMTPAEVWVLRDNPAGLPEADRLALCERVVQAPATAGEHVVWLAFEKAHIGGSATSVGPVTFYPLYLVQAAVQQAVRAAGWAPPELANPDSYLALEDFPDDSNTVFARVELGHGAFVDPVDAALRRAHAVVAVARFETQTTTGFRWMAICFLWTGASPEGPRF